MRHPICRWCGECHHAHPPRFGTEFCPDYRHHFRISWIKTFRWWWAHHA